MATLLFEVLCCKRRPFATLIQCHCHHSKVVKGHILSVDVQSLCKFKASSQDQLCLQLFFTQCTSQCWHICSETTKDSNANVAWSLLERSTTILYTVKMKRYLRHHLGVFRFTHWCTQATLIYFFYLFSKPFPYDLVLLEELLIVFIEFLQDFMDFFFPPHTPIPSKWCCLNYIIFLNIHFYFRQIGVMKTYKSYISSFSKDQMLFNI